jgi:hypothetical protein
MLTKKQKVMKKLIGIVFFVILSLSSLAQSREVIRERDKKIQEVQNSTTDWGDKGQRIASIYAHYDDLIRDAIRAEERARIAEEERRANKAPLIGSEFQYNGDRGHIRGRSCSSRKSAQAYAVSRTADANAALIESAAKSGDGTFSPEINEINVGGKGIAKNLYSHNSVEIIIKGLCPSSRNIRRSYILKPREKQIDYLPSGKYSKETINLRRPGMKRDVKYFIVSNDPISYEIVDGERYRWKALGGEEW